MGVLTLNGHAKTCLPDRFAQVSCPGVRPGNSRHHGISCACHVDQLCRAQWQADGLLVISTKKALLAKNKHAFEACCSSSGCGFKVSSVILMPRHLGFKRFGERVNFAQNLLELLRLDGKTGSQKIGPGHTFLAMNSMVC